MASTISRFAPSPTGLLHLGHAYSAVRAYDLARAAGGQFLLRIEDIDGTRSRPEFVAAIETDLRWLGLDWDGPVVRQSDRMALYADALDRLKTMGLVYPCFCTRAEIAASATAPHGDAGPVYPGTCRTLSVAEREERMAEPHCWRLDMGEAIEVARDSAVPFEDYKMHESHHTAVTPHALRGPLRGKRGTRGLSPGSAAQWTPAQGRGDDRIMTSPHSLVPQDRGLRWHDATAGWVTADPAPQGDVVLARKETPTSYHLAVTVDDAAQGVTDIVRGTDLFDATHIHRLLQALLGLPTPRYHHHPLLIGADGKRLAKRNGARPLAALRAAGADPAALVAALRAGELPIGVSSTDA